jgi:hypothetical protein
MDPRRAATLASATTLGEGLCDQRQITTELLTIAHFLRLAEIGIVRGDLRVPTPY